MKRCTMGLLGCLLGLICGLSCSASREPDDALLAPTDPDENPPPRVETVQWSGTGCMFAELATSGEGAVDPDACMVCPCGG